MRLEYDVLAKGKRSVDCNRFFTLKYEANEKIEHYKVCLVAKGFTQIFAVIT